MTRPSIRPSKPAAIAAIAAALLVLPPGVSHATLIYSFATDTVLFDYPPLSGSFSVADDAIADGVIFTTEVTSYLFEHGIFVYGDEPGDMIVLGGTDLGGLLVDAISGLLTARGDVSLLDASYAVPPTPQEARLMIDIGLPAGQNYFYDPGDDPGYGTWTCTRDGAPCAAPTSVPEPATSSLLAAGLVALLGRFFERRRTSARATAARRPA
jgi:hypothetical protein